MIGLLTILRLEIDSTYDHMLMNGLRPAKLVHILILSHLIQPVANIGQTSLVLSVLMQLLYIWNKNVHINVTTKQKNPSSIWIFALTLKFIHLRTNNYTTSHVKPNVFFDNAKITEHIFIFRCSLSMCGSIGRNDRIFKLWKLQNYDR